MRTLVSCALVVVIIACADARGAPSAPVGSTYYVSPNGSDANPGTSPSAPWRTLAKAASFPLVPGDEVLLEGGQTFAETLAPYSTDVGSAAAPIGYASYGDGRATIARGIYLNSNSYLTFSDLNVTNSGAGAKGIFSSASGVGAVGITLENLSVTNVAGYGIISDNPADSGWTIANVVIDQTGDSGVLFRGSGFTLTGSRITNTGTDSSISHPRHGVYAGGRDAKIVANTISGFSTSGVSFRMQRTLVEQNTISGGQSGVAYSPEDSAPGTSTILANTIEAVSDYGIGSASAQQSESFVVVDNTIASGGLWGMYFQAGPNLTIANNLVLATSSRTSYLSMRPQSGNYAEHHNLFFGSSAIAAFFWNGSAKTFAQYQSLSGQGGDDLFGDPQLDATLMPGPSSPALESGTNAVDLSLAYSQTCDGQPLHYCGLAVDLGATERPLPTPAAAPELSGSSSESGVIMTSAGSWTGPPGIDSYQWERCDAAGSSCLPISAQSGSSYILASADVGQTVRSLVTAANGYGSTTQTSAPSSVIGASGYHAAVLASTPLGYWRLSDSAGAPAADSAGNGRDGTFSASGVVYQVPGALIQADAAAAFASAGSGSVDLGDTLDFSGSRAFTLEAWIKPSSLDSHSRTIVAKQDPNLVDGYRLYMKSTGIGFNRRSTTGNDTAICSTRLRTGAWTYLAATYDGMTMRIYMNGAPCSGATTASRTVLTDNAGSLRIARAASPSSNGFFNGTVDEVAAYGQALPAASVQAHYAAR